MENAGEAGATFGSYVPAYRRPATWRRAFAASSWRRANGNSRTRMVLALEQAPTPRQPLVPNTAPIHDRWRSRSCAGAGAASRFAGGLSLPSVRERSGRYVGGVDSSRVAAPGHDDVSLLSLSPAIGRRCCQPCRR
jgi:hypothetical protein